MVNRSKSPEFEEVPDSQEDCRGCVVNLFEAIKKRIQYF